MSEQEFRAVMEAVKKDESFDDPNDVTALFGLTLDGLVEEVTALSEELMIQSSGRLGVVMPTMFMIALLVGWKFGAAHSLNEATA